MNYNTRHAGLDIHGETSSVAVADSGRRPRDLGKIENSKGMRRCEMS
jgi:hypothetical protein